MVIRLATCSMLFAGIASAQSVAASRVVAGRDSFALVMRGTVRGAMVVTRAMHGSQLRVTKDFSAPGNLYALHRETDLDATTLSLLRFDERESYRAMTVQSKLATDGSRITGTAEELGETGVRRTLVDAPTGVMSADVVTELIAAFNLSDSSKFSLPLFVAFPGAVRVVDFAVVGRQTLTVPAGVFDALRVLIRIPGKPPSEIFVTVTKPHRVLSIRDSNSDLQLVQSR